MKRFMSLFICITIILNFCAGCGENQTEELLGEMAEINMVSSIDFDEISDDNVQKDFIQQHIEYINNGSYPKDIVRGYPENMSGILEDATSDDSLDDYIVWKAINDILQADYEDFAEDISLDADDKYSLLLSEVLFRNKGEYLQELMVENISETTIDSVDIISSVLLDLASTSDDLYSKVDVDSIQTLNNQLGQLDPWSSRYIEVFDEMCSQIEEVSSYFSMDEIMEKSNAKISKELGDTAFIVGLGLDAASTVFDDIISYINYVRYGNAYLNANEYVKKVFQDMLVFSAAYSSSDFSDLAIFNRALESYISSMEEYEYDQAKSFANKASTLYGDIASDTAETVTKDICLQGVDCLFSIIPVIGPALIAAKDGSAILQTIWDVCSDTKDRAYARDMIYHCNTIAEVLYDVSEYYAKSLNDSDEKTLGEQFADAACFDVTINMYKFSCTIGAEYAERYETYLHDNAISKKRKSWHSTAINIASTQKLLSSEIKCHDAIFSTDTDLTYERVLDEYRTISAIDSEDYFADADNYKLKYPHVNPDLIDEYMEPYHRAGGGAVPTDEPYAIYYIIRDVDEDEIPELLIFEACHEVVLWDVFRYEDMSLMHVEDLSDYYSYYSNNNAELQLLAEDKPFDVYDEFISSEQYKNYIEIPQENISSDIIFSEYTLVDLNEDNVPELILREGRTSARDSDGLSMIFSYDRTSESIHRIDCKGNEGNAYEGNGLFGAYYGPMYTRAGLQWISGEGHGLYYYQYNGDDIIWLKDEYITYNGSTRVYVREDGQTRRKEYINAEEFGEDNSMEDLKWETIS